MFIYFNNWPFTIDVLGTEYDLLFWRVKSFSFVFVFTHNPTQLSSSPRLLICKHPPLATVDDSRFNVNNMETEMIDLSGYTPEERRHLESVMMRQRHEEEKDRIIVEKKREEMKILEETIQKQRNEMHKKVGSELEATCHICMKTKFADGVGHICNYCNIRCCARCGGKVTLRSNKVIWVCILCRKKQELLSKTGQWMNHRMSSNDSKQEHERDTSLLSDKRPKLERTQSAAEKENQPLERSGSLLRRQYSHQEQSRTNNDMMRGEKNRCSREEESRLHRRDMETKQGGGRYNRRGEMSGYKSDSYTPEKSLDRLENAPQRAGSSTVIYQSPSRKYRRSSKGESSMRKDMQTSAKPQQRNLPRQSFSSSDDELKSLSECTSEDRDYSERNSVGSRDKTKPSVLVTSPGSPDLGSIYRSRNSRISSVGGRIQVKIWFDSSTLKLVVTLVCAVGLIPRPNGQARNPYAKLYLLPDRSEKSKRRTKTLASTNEPKWNQHFVYTSVRRSDLKVKEIEISVWDYARYSTNDFLGEARIDLAIAPLNDEAEWIHLNPHEETFSSRADYGTYVSSDHLSPPSTTSRLSDSDTSDFDDSNRRVADGASISSLGSSTSPPPDYEKNERRRSKMDIMCPLEYTSQPYKGTLYKHQSLERDIYNKTSYSGYPQRSRSAAPTDKPSLHYRSRSKSPTGAYERSLSPTTHRAQSYGSVYPIPTCGPKIYTRSATSTPLSSPKRRMLPKIPTSVSSALRERIAHDLENRGMYMKNNHRARQPRQGGGRFSGWNRHHYGGLSDSDLPHQHRSLSPPSARELGFFCGPKREGDVDSCSIDSSTFSTQSEQPQKSRFDDYGRRESSQQSPSTSGPPMESLERSLSHSDMPNDKIIGENSYSDLNVHNIPQNDNQRSKCSPSTSERGSVKSIPGARGSPDSYNSLPKKSNSTSQLSATGRKRRLGFGSSMKSSFTVQRSEEIFPDEVRHLVKQTSSISSDGDGSQDGDSAGVLKIAEDEKYQNFIGTLGPGQLVGRQVLGTPPLGEVEVSIGLEKGKLEVEVIKARGLQQNPELKNSSNRPYFKLYLVRGKKCLEKNKTKPASPSALEPSYQARFTFKTNPDGCVLQITLWSDRKTFLGIAQIALNNLDLNRVTVGWYKLYKTCLL